MYKNVKNLKVEDNIYLSILNTENISNMHKISHVIIFSQFFDIFTTLHDSQIFEISNQ